MKVALIALALVTASVANADVRQRPANSPLRLSIEDFTKKLQVAIDRMRVAAPVPSYRCDVSQTNPAYNACISPAELAIWVVANEEHRLIHDYEIRLVLGQPSPTDAQKRSFAHLCTAMLMSVDPTLNRTRAQRTVVDMTLKAINATRGSEIADQRHDVAGNVAFFVTAIPGGSMNCSVMQDEPETPPE